MTKKYEAWVLTQIRVEFEDDGDLDLESQAFDALPIWATGAGVNAEAVYDLKEITDEDA